MRFHHIGVVTLHLEEAVTHYRELGYSASDQYQDDLQKATIVLMERDGDPRVELISPVEDRSPAHKWAQRLGAGPYHTCYEVDDLDAAINRLRKQRFCLAFGPAPAAAFGMRQVAFLWGRGTGLIELVEAARERAASAQPGAS
jgi:methylmalonyl-CoA/ethylmalonyl-CoA epimerase